MDWILLQGKVCKPDLFLDPPSPARLHLDVELRYQEPCFTATTQRASFYRKSPSLQVILQSVAFIA